MAEGAEVVRSKRQPDGRWLLDRIHQVASTSTSRAASERQSLEPVRAPGVLDWWDRTT